MYAALSDLQKLLPEDELLALADDDGAGSLADSAVIMVIVEAIDQADREIDSFVGMVRDIPMDPVPQLVVNISSRMAVYHLYSRRGQAPKIWSERYQSCLRHLEGVAEGRLSLGGGSGTNPSSRVRSADFTYFKRLNGEF